MNLHLFETSTGIFQLPEIRSRAPLCDMVDDFSREWLKGDSEPLGKTPSTMSTRFGCGLCDFDILYHTSMKSFYHDPHQEGRFENSTPGMTGDEMPPDDGFYMYWCGEGAANAVLGRNILKAAGYRVYTLWDLSMRQFCLLTDYAHNWNVPSSRS